MPLQHLGFNVQDPIRFSTFLETCFGMQTTLHAGRIVMLEDDSGFVLALAASEERPVYPPDFHLGFYVTENELATVRCRLADNGWEPTPIESIHGRSKFFVVAPGDVLIEVSTRGEPQPN